MAWVRIHDGAMTHPKILNLSDKAFRLWVWGLSYCQQHLTNGYIPLAALPLKVKGGVPLLLEQGLWSVVDRGFQVHDYLDWNDDKATVRDRQEKARRRMDRFRKRVENAVTNGVGDGVTNATITKPNQTSTTPPTPLAGGRVKREERKHAETILKNRFGQCRHDPGCGHPEACLLAIIGELRAKRGAA